MTISYSKLLLLFSIFILSLNLKAQENFNILLNPDIAINIKPQSRWSYNFSIANRDEIYKDENWNFTAKHLQLSHFTSYEVGFYSKISLGIRYRFREIFNKKNHDEFRIVTQFAHSRKYNTLKTAHRARFEQRIRNTTIYRWRYRFSLEFPLNGLQVDKKEFFIVTSTELLYSVGAKISPIPENRLSVSLGRDLGNSTNINIGLQYRYGNYFSNSFTDLFFMSGLAVSI